MSLNSIYLLAVVGIELRTLYSLDKCSTTELYPQPFFGISLVSPVAMTGLKVVTFLPQACEC